MSTYKAGDVAMVTALNQTKEYRAYFDGKTWREYGCDAFCVDVPTSIRPLVVIDFGPGRTPAEEAVRLLRTGDSNAGYETFLDWLADQIEAQTKPPRIPEPGLWGVVRASFGGHSKIREFVRYPDGWRGDAYEPVAWTDLHDPEPIREGVES